MEISVRGEMTNAEIKLALLEKRCEFEEDNAVRYSRGATVFINPTNGSGDEAKSRVRKLNSRGPYRSAGTTTSFDGSKRKVGRHDETALLHSARRSPPA